MIRGLESGTGPTQSFMLPALIILGMLFQTPQEQAAIDHVRLELEYDHAWYTYLMKELGCPVDVPIEDVKAQCNLPRQIDLQQFGKARRLAKQVFAFHD
jgi:hypothetical protein